MEKYQYAPGLPGYGTQGVDGSDGLNGIGLYFCDMDADIQRPAIQDRIDSNQFLLESETTPLPNGRVYNNGDYFIDINGKAWIIDNIGSGGDKYYYSGSRLNTSTIFTTTGVTTDESPVEFQRYSNAYGTDNFLIDNVYATTAIDNYVRSPEKANGIYNLGAKDFGQAKYVDVSINNYFPYTIYINTNDTGAPEKSIALVKDINGEHWRFGNTNNSGVIRDVSLSLDFKNVNINGNLNVSDSIFGDFEGTIETPNLKLSGWLDVDGDTSIAGNLYSTGNTFLSDTTIDGSLFCEMIKSTDGDILFEFSQGNYFNIGQEVPTNIYSNNTKKISIKDDVSIHSDLSIDGSLSLDGIGSNIYFKNNVGGKDNPLITIGDSYNNYLGLWAIGIGKMAVTYAGADYFIFDASNGGNFHASGNITGYSSTPSDIKLKENIESLSSGSLEKIINLRGVSYVRKNDKEKHIGYIAQEIENIIPEVVYESYLPLENNDNEIYKIINYTEIIPYLSEAIKEQQAQINDLKNIVEQQQTQINKLLNI